MSAGRLKGRVAVVTGAGAGMGEGIALLFAAEGASVAIGDRDEPGGARVAREIEEAGGRALFVRADVRSEADCRGLVDRAAETWGRLDVLVNNAGISTRGTLEDTTVELWDDVFAVNVRGAFLCLQQALRQMKPQRRGSIVNVGSVNAYIGEPKLLAYSASKGALQTLTKNAASQLARHRIRVNQVNPGWTLTPNEHRAKLGEGKGEDWVEDAVRTRPFGRLLLPQDVARAVLYFASDDSECVTGSVLDLEQYPVGAPPDW